MSPQYQTVLSTALELPDTEREQLVCDLVDSLSAISIGDLSPEWLSELERRTDEIKSGRVQGIPWETVQQQMHERLRPYDVESLPS